MPPPGQFLIRSGGGAPFFIPDSPLVVPISAYLRCVLDPVLSPMNLAIAAMCFEHQSVPGKLPSQLKLKVFVPLEIVFAPHPRKA